MKRFLSLFIFFLMLSYPLFFSIALAEEFRYDSHAKRDPFSIAKSTKITVDDSKSKVDIKLEGVVLDPGGKSVAVINGDMVAAGDKIGDSILVKKITKQGVEVEQDGKTFTIPIVTEDVNKTTI